VNYDILMSKERKNCFCTAMLYDPADHYEPKETQEYFEQKSKVYERLIKFKQSKFLQAFRKKEKQKEDEQKQRRSFVSLFSIFFS